MISPHVRDIVLDNTRRYFLAQRRPGDSVFADADIESVTEQIFRDMDFIGASRPSLGVQPLNLKRRYGAAYNLNPEAYAAERIWINMALAQELAYELRHYQERFRLYVLPCVLVQPEYRQNPASMEYSTYFNWTGLVLAKGTVL